MEQEVLPDDFAEVLIRHLMTGGKFEFPAIITTRDGPAKSLTVLEISGVNGIRTSKLNVLYVLVDDINNDKHLLKKQGDAEGRLLLTKRWCFTDTESKNANDCRGYC